ncbi:DUF4351 domain-containing protein [Cylindrospermopsis raciborskii]|uniref:DUF4351 domain-containing protein n=1 Tax=Cylindrospermopsis raciborskii TaxID=77022 RepID=UPI0030FE2FDC
MAIALSLVRSIRPPWIERESDVLLKAHSPECGDFILLNELQLRHDAKMPRRMRAYAALVEEKYGIESPVVERINRLSLEQLEAMGESLLDFRQISDLEAWLKDAEKSNDLKPQVDIQNGNQLDV